MTNPVLIVIIFIFKLSQKFVSTNKPVSYLTVREYFKSSFKAVVPDIAAFSTHSLRAEGASAAANASGADKHYFQGQSSWKSVSSKNGYIDDNLVSRLFLSQHLGIQVCFSIPVVLFISPFFIAVGIH